MRLRNVLVVARREYLSRVKTKGFWLATVALPLLMGAWMVVPSLVMSKTQASQSLAIVDTTGRIGDQLVENLEKMSALGQEQAIFEIEKVEVAHDQEAQRTELDRRVLEEEIAAWVWISDDGLAQDRVEYHAESVSNFLTQQILRDEVSNVVRSARLAEAGYDVDTIRQLSRRVGLETVRISEEGSRAEGGIAAFAVAIALFVILYMMILIYGSQVMQGVLEEKTSRVVEVMLSAVRPIELMAGKLAGICAAALTQLTVWISTAVVLTTPGLFALSFLPEGFQLPRLSPPLIAHFFGYFLLGFLFFAAFYAMIGSAFNNLQEAQQFSTIGVIFVVAPWIVFMPILNDPDSTLAVVTSLIPLFTPLLMILRIAVKMPPAWQIALSYVLTLATCAGMIWLSARVYRVGILMYGKKPSLKELWRWIRYS
jgi:ABC-2 type transport system permease protein